MSTSTQQHRRFNRQDYIIYNQLMRDLKLGIPILKPRPSSLMNFPNIGDVGYMKDGEFCKLFNVKELPGKSRLEVAFTKHIQKGTGGMQAIASSGISVVLSEPESTHSTITAPSGQEAPVVASTDVKTSTVAGQPSAVTPTALDTGSQTYTVTVSPDKTLGAVIFPVAPLRAQSADEKSKADLKTLMEKQVRYWRLPEGLSRNGLLLIHSRVMTAKWVMMRFDVKHNGGRDFKVTVDEGKVALDPSELFQADPAIEHGVDTSVLPPSTVESRVGGKPRKVNPTGRLDATTHCVFIGVFRAKVEQGSWVAEDIASNFASFIHERYQEPPP